MMLPRVKITPARRTYRYLANINLQSWAVILHGFRPHAASITLWRQAPTCNFAARRVL